MNDKYRLHRIINVILYALFCITGFSALLYQVAWQRMLGLFAGSDVISITFIIAAFLGGLGVGSLLGTRFSDQLTSQKAIVVFGLTNLGIALFAFLSKFFFYDFLFKELSFLREQTLVAFLVIVAGLLWPTTLMGLSLPLLAKAVVSKIENAARAISFLYSLNTLGSVIGALFSGWYLITVVGYEYTVYVGAALSMLVAVIALVVSRIYVEDDVNQPTAKINPKKFAIQDIPRSVWVWSVLVLISGFLAISLEIVWFRVIGIVIKSDSYTFAHLLAFILLGYGLGALFGSQVIERIRNYRRSFFIVLGLMVFYSVLSLLVVSQIFRLDAIQAWYSSASWFSLYIILPSVILIPPNFLIGFYFPLVQKAVQTNSVTVGQRVGFLQVANIIGNVLGSVVTGLFLLNVFGTSGTLRLFSLFGLFFVVILIRENYSSFQRNGKWMSVALLSSFIAIFLLLPSTNAFWSPVHEAGGQSGVRTTIVHEDATGVAVVLHSEDDTTDYILLNGYHQGSLPYRFTINDAHSILGSFPTVIHPDPEQILIIGVGGGKTAIAAGLNSQTENIQIVEIVGSTIPLLVDLSQEENGEALNILFDDPRYTISIGDGRSVLALSETKFDIIEADAIKPWWSGSGFLYSKEFFEQARSKLNQDGFMVQWLPTERVRRTFLEVFPYAVEIQGLVIVGSQQPIDIDLEAIQDRFANDPESIAYLAEINFQLDFENFVAQIRPAFPRTPFDDPMDINTDLFPRDEYFRDDQYIESKYFQLVAQGFEAMENKEYSLALSLLDQALELDPSDIDIYVEMAFAHKKLGEQEQAITQFNKAIELLEYDKKVSLAVAENYRKNGYLEKVAEFESKVYNIELRLLTYYDEVGKLHSDLSQDLLAVETYELADQLNIDKDSIFYTRLGNAYRSVGQDTDAVEAYEKAISLAPNNPRLYGRLGDLYLETNNALQAIELYQQGLALDPNDYKTHYSLAQAYLELDSVDEAITELQVVIELTNDEEYVDAAQSMLDELNTE